MELVLENMVEKHKLDWIVLGITPTTPPWSYTLFYYFPIVRVLAAAHRKPVRTMKSSPKNVLVIHKSCQHWGYGPS